MTIILDVAGQAVAVAARVEGRPAYRITGAGVRLTVQDGGEVAALALPILDSSGAVIAFDRREPAISIEAGGVVIENQAGGIIRAAAENAFSDIAIRGSLNTDRVINSGNIIGTTSLMGGNDVFIQRQIGRQTNQIRVDLGDGDDEMSIEGDVHPAFFTPAVRGGAGFDTLTVDGTHSLINFNAVSGVERLVLRGAITNVQGASGFSQIDISAAPFVNFVASVNTGVDLQLAGNWVTIGPGSRFRNVTGSIGADRLSLYTSDSFWGATGITGSADLGAGNDALRIESFGTTGTLATIGGTIDGGSGHDTVSVTTEAGITISLAQLRNFEDVDTGFGSSVRTRVRLVDVNDYLSIFGTGQGGELTLANALSPQASMRVGGLGSVILEPSATVGRYGFLESLGFGPFDQQQQGDALQSVVVINNGTILGAVQLFYGDDLYDGRLGTTGGPIFGYAGNDTLYGGAGNDRINGGFGGDDLFGGPGADTLVGGGGADLIDGGAGRDVAVFAGVRSAYQVTRSGGTITVSGGADGTDVLTGVERLQFADGTLSAVARSLFIQTAGGNLISWDATRGSAGFGHLLQVGAGSSVAGVADFTGDGAADVLFRIGPGDYVRWDVGLGGGGFAALSSFGAFQPVAMGDLRGGAGVDVLALSPGRDLVIFDIEANSSSYLLNMAPGFAVAGVGNIDGVGRADILFRNETSGALFALTDGGWRDLLTLGGGWRLAGLGDVVGGPADDFVFINDATRTVIFWDATAGSAGWRDFATIAPGWSISGFHDLDGDARTDVLLQHTDGNAIYWTGSSWGSLGNVLAGATLLGAGELG